MGARRRIAASVRDSRSVGRIVAGVLLSGMAVAVTLDLSGPAGADSTGARHGAAWVVTSVPTTVPPASVPPTSVPPTTVPQPEPQPESQSQSQPQPAIGAPAGTNPWDDPNAG